MHGSGPGIRGHGVGAKDRGGKGGFGGKEGGFVRGEGPWGLRGVCDWEGGLGVEDSGGGVGHVDVFLYGARVRGGGGEVVGFWTEEGEGGGGVEGDEFD